MYMKDLCMGYDIYSDYNWVSSSLQIWYKTTVLSLFYLKLSTPVLQISHYFMVKINIQKSEKDKEAMILLTPTVIPRRFCPQISTRHLPWAMCFGCGFFTRSFAKVKPHTLVFSTFYSPVPNKNPMKHCS